MEEKVFRCFYLGQLGRLSLRRCELSGHATVQVLVADHRYTDWILNKKYIFLRNKYDWSEWAVCSDFRINFQQVVGPKSAWCLRRTCKHFKWIGLVVLEKIYQMFYKNSVSRRKSLKFWELLFTNTLISPKLLLERNSIFRSIFSNICTFEIWKKKSIFRNSEVNIIP